MSLASSWAAIRCSHGRSLDRCQTAADRGSSSAFRFHVATRRAPRSRSCGKVMPSARCRKDALLPASHHIEVEGGSHQRVFTVAEEKTTKDKPTSIMLRKGKSGVGVLSEICLSPMIRTVAQLKSSVEMALRSAPCSPPTTTTLALPHHQLPLPLPALQARACSLL